MIFRQRLYKLRFFRYFFTVFGIALALTLLVFSLHFTRSIQNMLEESVALDTGEYHVYYNDSRFINTQREFYQSLKNKFGDVVPIYEDRLSIEFNSSTEGITAFVTPVISSLDKVYYENEIQRVALNKINDVSGVYIATSIYNQLTEQTNIRINGILIPITGTFSSEEDGVYGIIIPETLYVEQLNDEFYVDVDGNLKAPYSRYFIQTSLDQETTIDFITNLYFDPVPGGEFIDTHEELVTEKTNALFPFGTFVYVLVGLVGAVSILNLANSIHFSIIERKKVNMVLLTLGMTHRDFYLSYIKEYAVVALMSSLVSIVLGMIVAAVVVQKNADLDFAFLSISEYLGIILLTIVISVIYTAIIIGFVKRDRLTTNVME
ncbi:MAG: FtsX-like permease family protein [Bacilli bacterium]|nr:FtsX-like permease family protein [Bacilli bacterium]MBN2877687.1 FtsX-like permease family protein [Bacilli bacterium]